MKQEYPSLVLLDIMLPDEDGLSILKEAAGCRTTKRLPVIMLTAKGTEYDRWLAWTAARMTIFRSPSA